MRHTTFSGASADDFGDWLSGALAAGGCVRPAKLRPSMLRADPGTGELVPTADELADALDGVIYKACGDRRQTKCRSMPAGR